MCATTVSIEVVTIGNAIAPENTTGIEGGTMTTDEIVIETGAAEEMILLTQEARATATTAVAKTNVGKTTDVIVGLTIDQEQQKKKNRKNRFAPDQDHDHAAETG